MILVTGGCGIMGSALVKLLCNKGHAVRVVTLAGDPFVTRLDGLTVDIRFADISNKESLSGICNGITLVYHLAAIILTKNELLFESINAQGTRNVVDIAIQSGVSRFVYVSSASVTYTFPTAYARSKIAGEEAVVKSGLTYTIIRPTLVYDDRGGEEFNRFLAYLLKYPIVPFIGSGKALKRPVHVNEIINGLAAVATSEHANNKVYNFSGAQALSIKQFARLCLQVAGSGNKPIVSLPVFVCRLIACVMQLVYKNPPLSKQMIAGIIQDADLDPGSAIKDCGYSPTRVTDMLPHCFPRKIS